MIIAFHDTGTLQNKFSDIALFNVVSVLIYYTGLPAVSCLTDRTDFIYILYAEMNSAGTDRFGKSVIRIIFVIRKDFFPPLYKTGRNGLCTYVHESPLIKFVIFKFELASVDSLQNILSPRNEQPHDSALFL